MADPVLVPGRPLNSKPFGKSSSVRAGADVGEIYLYDEIGAGLFGGISVKDFAQALEELKDCPEIRIRLSSPGGDFFEGLAIYNLLASHPAKKTCMIDGLAASIASIIALACDHRITAANGAWMIHDARAFGVSGKAEDLAKWIERINRGTTAMAETYAKRTGRSQEEIRAWMADETWMNAAEAKDRGFSHETEGEGDQSAVVLHASALDRFQHTPPAIRLAASAVIPPVSPPPATAAAGANISPTGEEVRHMEKLLASLAARLGITSCTEVDVLAALTKHQEDAKKTQADVAALLALAGKPTIPEALGTFQGMKAQADKAIALEAKIAEDAKLAAKKEHDALIEQATKDGKIPPAEEDPLRIWAKAQPLDSLKAFVAAARPLVATLKDGHQPTEDKGTPPAVTDEQKKIAASLGADLSKVTKRASVQA